MQIDMFVDLYFSISLKMMLGVNITKGDHLRLEEDWMQRMPLQLVLATQLSLVLSAFHMHFSSLCS